MELNDLKKTWQQSQGESQEQNIVNTQTLEKMKDKKYHSNMKKIIIPEVSGIVICLAAAVFIGFNFYKLDTALLQSIGVLSILLLLLLPVFSLLSTWKFNKTEKVDQSYAATLQVFAAQKIRFIKLQKLNVVLSYLLLVTIIVLLPQFFGGKNLSESKYFWLFAFTIGYIFLLFYSRWVEKFYQKSLRQAEELLNELAV